MAIVAGFGNQSRLDYLNLLAGHNLYIALYLQANSNMNLNTATYTATGEISGPGYTAGGQLLTGAVVTQVGNTVKLVFADPSWAGATFTADAAVIYDASNSNDVIGFFTFTPTSSTGAPFTLTMNANGVIVAA